MTGPTANLSQETIQSLELKNKRLVGEIDKLQTQLFSAQDSITDLTAQLEEKKHSEQLAGWAIDRALQIRKESVESAIDDAEKLCAWVHNSSARDDAREKSPIELPKESMQ